ncbi:sensor histidine kinase [Marinicrinis lubricantis]|uniref:Sensor histidine kinase n=1 Tax=Marinicrinis lubricantis TaxID=2086470 RepID=A0ABW1IS94_9BACL
MGKWKKHFARYSLKHKLIIAFSCFIILPFFLIGWLISWLYVDSNRTMMMEAAVDSNEQIVSSLNGALDPLIRLSMYPVMDQTILNILLKDYGEVEHPLYERQNDFEQVNEMIQNSIMLYSELIDNVVIVDTNKRIVIGRSSLEYMDFHYLQDEFFDEPFVRRITEEKGKHVFIGVHQDLLQSSQAAPVVSVGRAIVDPQSRQTLGMILINVNVEKLNAMSSEVSFTENTRFYLIDENDRVIYSENEEEIGAKAGTILGKETESLHYRDEQKALSSGDTYLISSNSELTGWLAVTVIPKNEMFSFVYVIAAILFIGLFVFLLLSIATAVYLATTITKPLSRLEKRMRRVAAGNMDVAFDDMEAGEIGQISKTVDYMLKQLRELIHEIVNKEEEKRRLEMVALQTQIKPHFMYNTLNVIKWMAKIQGAAGIEEALGAFSSVIKFTTKAEQNEVSIQEEVEFIRNYTKILSFRYFGRFEVAYDIDSEVLQYKTLKFLLQPLVENAVFHGFDEIDYMGHLHIRIYKEADTIYMVVSDNGRGISGADTMSRCIEGQESAIPLNSIGIKNIRKRIELHYGEEYGLSYRSAGEQGTEAVIRIPAVPSEQAGKEV